LIPGSWNGKSWNTYIIVLHGKKDKEGRERKKNKEGKKAMCGY